MITTIATSNAASQIIASRYKGTANPEEPLAASRPANVTAVGAWNSYAPLSHVAPCGRETPRWSIPLTGAAAQMA